MTKTIHVTNPERAQMRWLNGLRRQAGWPMALAIGAPLIAGGLLLWQASALARLLHSAVVEGVSPELLLPALIVIAGLIGVRALLGFVADRAGVESAERIKAFVRSTLFAELLARRSSWVAGKSSGALSATIVDQVEALDGFFVRFFPAMIQATLLPIVFALVMLPVDWVVAVLFLVTAPLIPVFMALVGWGAEAATKSQANAFARLSGLFADRLRGMVTLKLFGRAEAETIRVAEASESLRKRTLKVLRIAFLSSAVLEFFAALGVAGVALYIGLTYLGLINLRGTSMSLEAGLFCLLMAPEVYQPLRLLAAHYHDRASAKAAVGEIAAQFDALPMAANECVIPAGAVQTGAVAVALTGLSMKTPGGAADILVDASLDVPAGSHIALLGESGIGKSTLLEALARLRDYRGTITLDGTDLEVMDEGELRTRVAFIGQRPRIFHGTIGDNIGLACAGATADDINRAAGLAGVTDFANALPDGLDTLIGENGLGLSGGQIQRVALARLYLRDPGLILLDEPTAHLDPVTENRILDAIMTFAEGRTLVIVTHSASVAARMQRTYRIAGHAILMAPHKRAAQGNSKDRGVA